MRLAELLKAMACNEKVNITLIDTDDKVLIVFGAKGYEAVEADVTQRTVKKIKVDSVTNILVYIDDAPVPSI